MAMLRSTLLMAFIAVGYCALTGHQSKEDSPENRHLTSNAAYYLESYDKPEFAFGFNYDGIDVFLTWKRRRFTIQTPGVNRELGTISLKSTDRPDYYITHVAGYGMLLQARDDRVPNKTIEQFENDATFVARDNLFHTGYAAFETFTREGYFIGHKSCTGLNLCLDLVNVWDNRNNTTIQDSVSFRRKEGPYVIESYDPYRYFVGIDGQDNCNLDKDAHYWYLIHPSLQQDDGTISLESASHIQHYLRHNYSSSMSLTTCYQDECKPDGPTAMASSFVIEKDKFVDGYFALGIGESKFVRHTNYSISVEEIDDSDESAKNSSSWRTLRGPFYLESVGYVGHALTWKQGSKEIFLDRDSTRLVFIYPGLTRQGGTISIQLADRSKRKQYLRFVRETGELLLDDVKHDEPFYTEDATFWLQEDVFEVNTLSFESYRRRGHYIVKSGKDIRITNNFKPKDAAFYRVNII